MAEPEEQSISSVGLPDTTPVRRSSRERKRNRKSDALEKIKLARQMGIRQEEELEVQEDLFDMVTEEEYAKIIHKRQKENWVLDDDGTYSEHGREIFDEEVSTTPTSGKPKKTSFKAPRAGGNNDIKSMVMSMGGGAKKKSSEKSGGSVKEDSLLNNLLSTIHIKEPSPTVKAKQEKSSLRTSFSPRNPSKVSVVTPKRVATPIIKRAHVKKEKIDPLPISLSPLREEVENRAEFNDTTMELFELNNESCENRIKDEEMEEERMTQVKEEEMEEEKAVTIERRQSCPTEAVSITGWETVKEELISQDPPPTREEEMVIDGSLLPLHKDEDGNKFVLFYWLDAYEDPFHQPGVVYLFGKVWIDQVQSHVSCCIVVRNIERCLYFLPREKLLTKSGHETNQDVTMKDVYMEFNDKFAEKHRIMKFSSKCVDKKYCFEIPDVPSESKYLEVRYSAHHPAPPTNSTGCTYSKVFGTNTSSLERLIIGCSIKGPCWLTIKSPSQSSNGVSWCKIECSVDGLSSVGVSSEQTTPPPLTVLSLSIKTLLNSQTRTNEILCIGALIHRDVSLDKPPPSKLFQSDFCCIRTPQERHMPHKLQEKMAEKGLKLEITPSERGLLAYFLAKLAKVDPDIIVGHNLATQWLEMLQHRMFTCKVPSWSRIGRLKRSTMPKGKGISYSLCCGRIVCDVKLSAKELIRSRSYDMTELANSVLHVDYHPMENGDVSAAFGSIDTVCHLVSHTMEEALLSLRLTHELCVLPLAYQITCIAGNVFSRTLLGGRSERNEFLLLHAFTQKGYLPPDKRQDKRNHDSTDETDDGKRGKSSYTGGLVLDPKVGFYDRLILLLDFNSLYPSIIQEYNICFTTIDHAHCSSDNDIASLEPPGDTQPQGILPTQIRVLVERRRQVKQLMKEAGLAPEILQQYDIRQKALKLTANSMYGCLGFSNSRFYAKPLAALVTGLGRKILEETKNLTTKLGLDVIYGDTDSIMIDSGTKDLETAESLAKKVKTEVNQLYKLLEIDVDGIFKCMLLLKKKKYAAVSIQNHKGQLIEKRELKGLDIIRRDWCDLSKRAGHYILDKILAGHDVDTLIEEIQLFLNQLSEEVKNGQTDMSEFIITKGLNKLPKDYPDKKSLPHVQVAMRMLSRQQHVQAGDVIPYIICEADENLSPSLRAYHPSEVTQQGLIIDYKYYLQFQVHAVVTRLCEPIEGLDAVHLAEWLGLDSSSYKRRQHREEDEEIEIGVSNLKVSTDRADPLLVNCSKCSKSTKIESQPGTETSYKCINCSNSFTERDLILSLDLALKYYISLYYQGWIYCTECGYRARVGGAYCPLCGPYRGGESLVEEYTSSDLYSQMCYYKNLVQGYDECFLRLQECLDNNSYTRIDLSKLFPVFKR